MNKSQVDSMILTDSCTYDCSLLVKYPIKFFKDPIYDTLTTHLLMCRDNYGDGNDDGDDNFNIAIMIRWQKWRQLKRYKNAEHGAVAWVF